MENTDTSTTTTPETTVVEPEVTQSFMFEGSGPYLSEVMSEVTLKIEMADMDVKTVLSLEYGLTNDWPLIADKDFVAQTVACIPRADDDYMCIGTEYSYIEPELPEEVEESEQAQAESVLLNQIRILGYHLEQKPNLGFNQNYMDVLQTVAGGEDVFPRY